MKKVLLFIIITIICNSLTAQKIKLGYGANFGINFTQLVPDYEIDQPSFSIYDKNIQISSEDRFGLGYNIGVFLRINLLNNKFYLQTSAFVSHIGGKNKYIVSYDHYSSSDPVGNRIYIEGYDYTNVLNTIKTPVVIGYQRQPTEKLSYGLFGGMSPYFVLPESTAGKKIGGIDEFRGFFLSYLR